MPLHVLTRGLQFDSKNVRNRFFLYQTFILLFTFACYTSYHMSRKPISVVKSVLHQNCETVAKRESLTLTPQNASFCSWKPFDQPNYAEMLGSLEYAYLFSYAIGMLMSGHLAERIHLRYYLGVGMLLSGLTTALFGMGYYWQVHSLGFYIGVQIAGGLVQATGWPSVVACVGNWFGKGRRGFIMGVWNSHTSAGNILGSVLAGLFVNQAWGLSFLVPGAAVAAIGIICLLLLVPHPSEVGLPSPHECSMEIPMVSRRQQKRQLRNSSEGGGGEKLPLEPGDSEDQEEEEEEAPDDKADVFVEKPAIGFIDALRIPGVVEYSLCLFFAKLVSYTFLYWLPNYIKHSNGLDPKSSAFLSTLFDIGGIFGGIVAGVLSDVAGRAITCSGMLLLAAPMLLIYQRIGGNGLMTSAVLLLLTGGLVNGPYALITTAVSADLGTSAAVGGNSKALATVTAIIDGTGSMGAAFGPLLTGWIVPTGWHNVFYMLICADLAALAISSLVCCRQQCWHRLPRVLPVHRLPQCSSWRMLVAASVLALLLLLLRAAV